MRFSSAALVLATATIGQVAAGPVKHSHMQFHDKKDAGLVEVENEVEYQGPAHVVKRDLSDVDWSKVSYTYSVGQTWGQATAAAVAPAAAASTATVIVKAKTTTAAAAATTADSSDSLTDVVESVIDDITDTLETLLSDVDAALLSTLGALTGSNSKSSSAGVWLGDDGAYTMEVANSADEDVVLVAWGAQGSWVNAVQPHISISLPKNEKVTISFADGQSGAISAIYSDTKLVNGQVSNTWAEFTFESPYSTVDISREVLMTGHTMEVVTPECVTNMDTCVFVCTDDSDTCTYNYKLTNCAINSQTGANTDASGQNGGCSGMGATANLTMTLS